VGGGERVVVFCSRRCGSLGCFGGGVFVGAIEGESPSIKSTLERSIMDRETGPRHKRQRRIPLSRRPRPSSIDGVKTSEDLPEPRKAAYDARQGVTGNSTLIFLRLAGARPRRLPLRRPPMRRNRSLTGALSAQVAYTKPKITSQNSQGLNKRRLKEITHDPIDPTSRVAPNVSRMSLNPRPSTRRPKLIGQQIYLDTDPPSLYNTCTLISV